MRVVVRLIVNEVVGARRYLRVLRNPFVRQMRKVSVEVRLARPPEI